MVTQISVFLENRAGRALEVCETLKKHGADLLTLTIADTKDFGILRFVARDNEKAAAFLKDAGFTAKLIPLAAVTVRDQPGGLAGLLKVLSDGGLSVEYLYSFARDGTNAVILLQTGDNEKAERLLSAGGFETLSELK